MKEPVYELERSAMCELELMLDEKDKIDYKYTKDGTEQSDSIEVKKLLHKATKTQAKYPDSKPEGPPVEAQALRLLGETGAVRGTPLGLGIGEFGGFCTVPVVNAALVAFTTVQCTTYGGRKVESSPSIPS